MQQLVDKLSDHSQTIADLLDHTELEQANEGEIEEILISLVETVKAYEGNEKELEAQFGKDIATIMKDMKYAAVALHRALPAYKFISNNVPWMHDDLSRYCDDLIYMLNGK